MPADALSDACSLRSGPHNLTHERILPVRLLPAHLRAGEYPVSWFLVQRPLTPVVSKNGKEATIGILNQGDFFGEGCLAGQTLRLFSATAMTDCSVMRIDKKSMVEVLHQEHAFSDLFVAYLLTRNIRYEEDLVDQLFNSSEKRLAPDPFAARSFWQGRQTRESSSQDESGDAGGNDRHHPVEGQFLHE
jgi:Cyclic nucleotide-binding domain